MPVTPSKSDSTKYWAAESNSEAAAGNIGERIRAYRERLRESGRAARMVRGFKCFYGYAPDGDGDTSVITSSGDQGEYVDVTTNDYATLVTQSAVRTTANKPGFKAVAVNADSTSLEQTSFAQGLLVYASNTHSIEDRDYEMVMIGDICSEGWEIQGWDATAGKNLTEFVEGGPTNEGDIKIHSSTPFRVAYDLDAEDVDSLQWIAFKRRYNRFDLSASIKDKYPDASEKLLDMGDGNEKEWMDGEDNFDLGGHINTHASADLVWVWEFRHLPSPSLPNGRLLKFVTAECVVFDSFETQKDEQGDSLKNEDGTLAVIDHGYPYDTKDLHAYRYCPDNVIGSIAGHTSTFDLLGLQQLKDTLATMTMTAANAGGISNLWTRTGDKPVVSQTVGSMNFIQSQTAPEPIEGVQLSDQVPAASEFVDRQMRRRLGESDASMGEVPAGMPGNLAALLEAKTVQYKARGQRSYAHVLERSRTGLLRLYKRFAKTERVAVLGGKANEYKYKSWTAADLSGVDRFTVESVSPLTQTYSGKLDAAKELLDHNMVESPAQYLLLRETGRLEPLLESVEAILMSVRKEKEMLQQGIGLPPVDVEQSFLKQMPVFMNDNQPHIRPLMYDKHWLFIPEDLGVLAMPMVRDDGKITTAVTGVVEERTRLLRKMDRVSLTLLGCPEALIEAIVMMQMPPLPPGTSATPPPKEGSPSETKPPKNPEVPGLPAGAPRIAAPKPAAPPTNPLTGIKPESPVIQ